MEQTIGRLRFAWIQLKPLLKFRPVSGRLWLDTFELLLVGTLHFTVLPAMTRGLIAIDLMTPWLVTTLVCVSLSRGVFLAAFGALILETHSIAPAGFYLCSYWVITVVIQLTRSTLSWRHVMPWLITFSVSQIWLVAFFSLVLAVNAGSSSFDWRFLRTQSEMVISGVAIGMLLCRRFLAGAVMSEEL